MDHNVIDMKELLQNRYFAEDDLPRTGSIYPEFSHTMTICVDTFEHGLAQGRIHNSETTFLSLDQMLLGMDGIWDRAGECQRDTLLRTKFEKGAAKKNPCMSDKLFAEHLANNTAKRELRYLPRIRLGSRQGVYQLLRQGPDPAQQQYAGCY